MAFFKILFVEYEHEKSRFHTNQPNAFTRICNERLLIIGV